MSEAIKCDWCGKFEEGKFAKDYESAGKVENICLSCNADLNSWVKKKRSQKTGVNKR